MSLHYLQAKSVGRDGRKIVDSELGEGIKEGRGLCAFGAQNVLQSERSLDITCA